MANQIKDVGEYWGDGALEDQIMVARVAGGFIRDERRKLTSDLNKYASNLRKKTDGRRRMSEALAADWREVTDSFLQRHKIGFLRRTINLSIDAAEIASEGLRFRVSRIFGRDIKPTAPNERAIRNAFVGFRQDSVTKIDQWFDQVYSQTNGAVGRIINAGLRDRWEFGRTIDTITNLLSSLAKRDGLGYQIKSLAFTSAMQGANDARRNFYDEVEFIEEIEHLSTLDRVTCPICRAYDRKRFRKGSLRPVGHDLPYNGGVSRHPNCRCVEMAVLPSFDDLPEDLRAQVPPTYRASRGGYRDGDDDYLDWLRDQPRKVQAEILGPSRVRVLREGRLKDMADFLDYSTGDSLTVPQVLARFNIND